MYSLGIEEEYFVFDAYSRRAINASDPKFLASVKRRLGDRVATEMLQSQLEFITPPCGSCKEAREHLVGGRAVLAAEAKARGLGIAAMGTFPLADWSDQTVTPHPRYHAIVHDLQMVGLRNMLCGMHVHVAVPDPESRVELMMRLIPYLPLLLALSTSSPFWQGRATGLRGYRLAAYDELPRTGLPEFFRSKDDYEEYVSALAWAGIIPDASHIWWALRPSLRYPTIELRVADSCTDVEDAVSIAALFRCLVRALDRDRALNSGFDCVGRAITVENKWHAQRYGMSATFVDPFRRQPTDAAAWLEEIMDFIDEDIHALDCADEIARLGHLVVRGTSADRQIEIFDRARRAGRARLDALAMVVDWAAAETLGGDTLHEAKQKNVNRPMTFTESRRHAFAESGYSADGRAARPSRRHTHA
jgi:glutamate---cysteine ligase / carboxylate-amine ligase